MKLLWKGRSILTPESSDVAHAKPFGAPLIVDGLAGIGLQQLREVGKGGF